MSHVGTSKDVLGNTTNIKSLDEFLNVCPLLAEHSITFREGIRERTLFVDGTVTVSLATSAHRVLNAVMMPCGLEETKTYIVSSADFRHSVFLNFYCSSITAHNTTHDDKIGSNKK